MAENVPEGIAFVADRLAELPFGDIRVKTGIYFLIQKGTIIYVGMTSTGAKRPMEHIGVKRFNRALYLPVRKGDTRGLTTLYAIETAFIQRLKPPLNGGTQTKPFPPKPYHVDLDAWFGEGGNAERARIAAYRKGQRDADKAKRAYARSLPDYHLATFTPEKLRRCLEMRRSGGSKR